MIRRKNDDEGMSIIVKSAASLLSVPITVFGIYIILHGHLTPGGGFPGGAVLATLVALFLVAAGREKAGRIRKEIITIGESLGILMFALLAFLGLGTTFLFNFLANSGQAFGMSVPFGANPGYMWTGGVIPLMNMAVGLEVFVALSIIAVVMYTFSDTGEEKRAEIAAAKPALISGVRPCGARSAAKPRKRSKKPGAESRRRAMAKKSGRRSR